MTFKPNYDKAIHVEFYENPVLNKSKTLEAGGTPTYDSKTYIRIHIPAARDNIMERPATKQDFDRYADSYAAFKKGQEVVRDGLDLALWAYATAAQVKSLKGIGIYTVEQLANSADNIIPKLGIDGRTIRDAARDYLSSPDDKLAEINKLHGKISDLTATIDDMREQNKAMLTRLDSITAEKQKQKDDNNEPVEVENDAPKRGKKRSD